MENDGWQPARLIPTSGINGPDEAERRATSALLAVLHAVREFRVATLRRFGAPAGALECFIEVPLRLDEDRTVIPDGLLQVTRGKTRWTALVEVKTGSGELQREQVENYLDAARDQNFDCVITISNQLAPAPGVHPVSVDKRKLRRVELHHLSWAEIVTAAVQTRVHRGVEDPDQSWILGELVRYLEHPRSGALDFDDMGQSWVAVRDAAVAGTLRANDQGVLEVASRWDQLLRFAAIRLGRELGADVQVVIPRKELAEPTSRLSRFVHEFVTSGTLSGTLRIPDAISDVDVVADVRANTIAVTIEAPAPQEGRHQTRVNWLVRQLADAPAQLRVDALLMGTRASTSELLGTVRDDPTVLIDPQKRGFRAFRLTALSSLGTKRGTGRGAFIDSVLSAIDGFYEGVVQPLRPWSPKAPQLPRSGKSAAEEAGIDTTPPPADLTDDVTPDLTSGPDHTATPPGVEGELTVADGAPVAPSPPPPPTLTMVMWDRASERLDREREHATHRPDH